MIAGSRPTDEEVRALTEQILSGAEFARWKAPLDWPTKLLEWLGNYIAWLEKLAFISPALYWLFLLGLTGVALAMIAHVVWSIRASFSLPGPTVRQPSIPEAPRWAEEAQLLASQGRFLDGAHHLVLGSIDMLVEHGLVELGRADANRVLRERLGDSTLPEHVRARFLSLLDAFEERWFRDRVEDSALYRAWLELHSQIAVSVGTKA